ncbi:uncharacterized protein LOC130725703 [Lotus japonicus]|uniref:uncharacterized protein LOC130725703 n=1 Tax=Lotus japonicus TaxID=34305 RepID=UPI00258A87E3|nr:uncharacterized protein LOC130725703 [Lotus japonicus]
MALTPETLHKLSYLMQASYDGGKVGKENSTEDGGSRSRYNNCRGEGKVRFSNEGLEDRVGVYSDDQNEISKRAEKPDQLLRRDDDHDAETPFTSLEKWYRLTQVGS